MITTSNPKSFCFYSGPSLLDGAPILAIATGVRKIKGLRTENAKTGDLVQTWIFRADREPQDAIHSGHDSSVCGACPLRPFTAKGTGLPLCYASCSGGRAGIVNVYRSWQMGNIPLIPPGEAAELLFGRSVRLGSYGDPAAVPLATWDALLWRTVSSVGYTHQWQNEKTDPRLSQFVMASVESEAGRGAAKQRGYRTFRLDLAKSGAKLPGEVRCPGSAEAGKKLTCEQCRACDGGRTGRRADIVIDPHSSGYSVLTRKPKIAKPVLPKARPSAKTFTPPPPVLPILAFGMDAARQYVEDCSRSRLPVSRPRIECMLGASDKDALRFIQATLQSLEKPDRRRRL